MIEKPKRNEDKKHEKKHEKLTPDFLATQAQLPREEWDPRFREFIEKKTKQNQEYIKASLRMIEKLKKGKFKKPEEPQEIKLKKDWNRYKDFLRLTEKQLKGKKILDLGCGKEGTVIKYLIEREITSEAYGVDLEIDESLLEPKYKSHLFRGDFNEEATFQNLPVKNFDYIFIVGALLILNYIPEEELPTLAATYQMVINEIKILIKNCLSVLSKDGEIRIYPVAEASAATPNGLGRGDRENWEKLLKDISEELNIEYRLEPRKVSVIGRDNDIVIFYLLRIRRKK